MKEFHTIIDTTYPSMACMHTTFMHTHNQYLEILTSLGMIGLGIFLWIFYALWKMPLKEREMSNIRYIYISVMFFSFIPEVLWGRQFSLAFSAFILSLLIAQYRIENENPHH